MTQRTSLIFGGITWFYGLAANAWPGITPGTTVVGKSGANNALYGAGKGTLIGGGGAEHPTPPHRPVSKPERH
jgi:hypothetical protein